MTIRHGLIAEFSTPDALLASASALHALGYRQIETYAPFPIPDMDDRLGLRRSRLPRLVFVGGLAGAVLGYGIQWYANVWIYALQVGGRPSHAIPAFIPVSFEATILGASLVAFFGLLAMLRMPEPWHPLCELDGFERASVDRFWIAVDDRDPLFDPQRTRAALVALTPLRVVAIPEPSA